MVKSLDMLGGGVSKTIDFKFIDELLIVDVQIVNLAFSYSSTLGVAAIKNSISSFRELLVFDIGPFINGMNIEYRTYVVGLLDGINSEYLEDSIISLFLGV